MTEEFKIQEKLFPSQFPITLPPQTGLLSQSSTDFHEILQGRFLNEVP